MTRAISTTGQRSSTAALVVLAGLILGGALCASSFAEAPNARTKLISVEVTEPNDLIALVDMGGRVEAIKDLATKLHPHKEIGKREIMEMSRKLELLEEYNYVVKKRKGRNVAVVITDKGEKAIALHPIFTQGT